MIKVGLWVRMEAKPGQEAALGKFLADALHAANAETLTPAWFAVKIGPSTFAIFDVFENNTGRQAHLNGAIAASLMARAPELLAAPPKIEELDVLAAKLPA
jgi:quinol monooxygenase YgiN